MEESSVSPPLSVTLSNKKIKNKKTLNKQTGNSLVEWNFISSSPPEKISISKGSYGMPQPEKISVPDQKGVITGPEAATESHGCKTLRPIRLQILEYYFRDIANACTGVTS